MPEVPAFGRPIVLLCDGFFAVDSSYATDPNPNSRVAIPGPNWVNLGI